MLLLDSAHDIINMGFPLFDVERGSVSSKENTTKYDRLDEQLDTIKLRGPWSQTGNLKAAVC